MDSVVLAIDPGARPGLCLTLGGHILWAGCEPDDVPDVALDALVMEGQHPAAYITRGGRRVKVSRRSQQSLSFTAGRLFERFSAPAKYRIPVEDWRRVLWPGCNRLVKNVVLHRLLAMPGVPALVEGVPRTRQGDVLEAIGIALAWNRLPEPRRRKYLL